MARLEKLACPYQLLEKRVKIGIRELPSRKSIGLKDWQQLIAGVYIRTKMLITWSVLCLAIKLCLAPSICPSCECSQRVVSVLQLLWSIVFWVTIVA